jgi:hypothetical protein
VRKNNLKLIGDDQNPQFFSPATPIALDAQEQAGTFFQTDGHSTINPDPTYFEVPIAGPLPETLNFLP